MNQNNKQKNTVYKPPTQSLRRCCDLIEEGIIKARRACKCEDPMYKDCYTPQKSWTSSWPLLEVHLKDKETYFQIQFITWLFGMNGTKDVNNIGIFTRDFSKKYDTELQEMRIRQQKLLIEFSNKLLGLDTDDPIAIEQHIVDALSLNPYLMINDEDFLADPIPNCDELHPMVAPHARIDPCEDIMAISTQNCDTLITPSALHSHTVGTETQDDPSTSESAPNVSISAIPQQQQIQMWCCPNCTFEQEDYLDKCEVCGELNVIDVSRDNPLPSPTAA
eukprot:959554_1